MWIALSVLAAEQWNYPGLDWFPVFIPFTTQFCLPGSISQTTKEPRQPAQPKQEELALLLVAIPRY